MELFGEMVTLERCGATLFAHFRYQEVTETAVARFNGHNPTDLHDRTRIIEYWWDLCEYQDFSNATGPSGSQSSG
jgi:hypothetical protein